MKRVLVIFSIKKTIVPVNETISRTRVVWKGPHADRRLFWLAPNDYIHWIIQLQAEWSFTYGDEGDACDTFFVLWDMTVVVHWETFGCAFVEIFRLGYQLKSCHLKIVILRFMKSYEQNPESDLIRTILFESEALLYRLSKETLTRNIPKSKVT